MKSTVVILCLIYLRAAAAENVGDLRFAGKGARSSAGRLEIFLGAGYEWGTVSHRAFDQRSADVACRQLGYEGAKSFGLAMNSSFGVGDSWWTFLNDSRCTGDELHLLRCHWSAEPCARCDHSEDIAIECSTKPLWAVPYEGQVRLIGPYPSKGVVEIYLRSEWGGVCCDNAAFTEANSVCRQLGYTNANGIDYRKHGGVMWINSFRCEESQACFTNCYHYSEVGKDWTQNCATGSLVVSCEYLSEGPYSTSFTTCEWELSNITATSSPFTTTLELDPTTSLSLLPSSTESIACLSEPATYTCTTLQSDYSCSSQAPLPQSTSMCATPVDQTLEMHTFTANPSIVTITLDTTTTAISQATATTTCATETSSPFTITLDTTTTAIYQATATTCATETSSPFTITLDTTTTAISQATATTTCATETSSPFVLSTSVILTEISMLMTLLSPAPTLSPSTRAATLSEDFQPSTYTNTAGPPDPSTSTATTTPLLSPTPDTPFSINDLLAMALGSFGLLILAAMGIFLVAIICIQCISCYRKRGGCEEGSNILPWVLLAL
eukprot:Em0010g1019a